MYSSSTSHRSVGGGGGGISTSGGANVTATNGSNRFASNSSTSKFITSHSRSKSVDDTSRDAVIGGGGDGGGGSSNISYHRTTTSNTGVGSGDNRRSTTTSRDYKSHHDLDSSLYRDKGVSSVRHSTSVSHGGAARVGGGTGYSYKDVEVCTNGICDDDKSDDRLIVEEGGVDHRSSKNQYRIVGRITRSPSPEARYKTTTSTATKHHYTGGGDGGRSRDVSGGVGSTSIEYLRSNTDINTGYSRRDNGIDRRDVSFSRDVDRGRFTKDGMAILGGSSRDFRSGLTSGGYGDGGGSGGGRRLLPATGQNSRRDQVIFEVDGGDRRGEGRGGGGYRRTLLDSGARRGAGGRSRPMGGYDRYSSPDHLRNMSYDDDRMGSTNMRGRSGKSGGYPNRLHRQRGRSSTYQRGPRQSIRRSRSMNDLLPRTPSPSKRQVNIDLNDSFPVCRRFPNCSVCAIDIPQYNQNVRWLSKK